MAIEISKARLIKVNVKSNFLKLLFFMPVFLCSTSLLANASEQQAFSHAVWDDLLQKHIKVYEGGKSTTVNYVGIAKDKALLKRYLDQLTAVDEKSFKQWGRDEQLAFLINAYNAWTVELILQRYPDLKSIRELGSFFRSPWSRAFIPLLGEERSLDDIEHKMIRGSGLYNEPRIHFAVNCASIGCPALRVEAYVAEKLEQQLEEQTVLFLADKTRNRIIGNTLEVSSIFKWYRQDFEAGHLGVHSLEDFFIKYAESLSLTKHEIQVIQNGRISFRFLSYDWSLNDKK